MKLCDLIKSKIDEVKIEPEKRFGAGDIVADYNGQIKIIVESDGKGTLIAVDIYGRWQANEGFFYIYHDADLL